MWRTSWSPCAIAVGMSVAAARARAWARFKAAAVTVCVAASAAVLAVGCAVGPGYQRPAVELPDRWQANAAPDAPAAGAWWAEYRSAELDRLMAEAIAGNRDLRAAASRVAQARALAQAAGASQWPALGANANATRGRRTGGNGGSGEAVSSSFDAGIAAVFELDFWGKNARAHDAALARVQSSEYAQRAVQLALQAEVATAYFRALSAADRLAIARHALANAEAVLRLVRVQREAGALSGLELARQQALVASVNADIAPIEQQRQQALDALAVLTGRPPQALGLAGTSLASMRLPPVAAHMPAHLLTARPEIRQAEADLVAANADLRAARAAFFPSIVLTAAGGFESASLASLLRAGSVVHALAAGLTAPLFDGGRLRAQQALATAREDELVQVYQQSILTALRDVEASLVAAQRLAEQAAHQREVIAHADVALRLAETRFRSGAIDFTTVLDAQRVLLAARAAQAATEFERYAASVALQRALGGSATGGSTGGSTGGRADANAATLAAAPATAR